MWLGRGLRGQERVIGQTLKVFRHVPSKPGITVNNLFQMVYRCRLYEVMDDFLSVKEASLSDFVLTSLGCFCDALYHLAGDTIGLTQCRVLKCIWRTNLKWEAIAACTGPELSKVPQPISHHQTRLWVVPLGEQRQHYLYRAQMSIKLDI